MTTTATTQAPQMIFMSGGIASGKSTHSEKVYGRTHTFIDADSVKATHPDYDAETSPKDSEFLNSIHRWSVAICEQMVMDACASGVGLWVVDGTGTNVDKMIRRMNAANKAGFQVVLVYVKCTVETSLRRNAARPRSVLESVLREKAQDIDTAFEITREYAHIVIEINNDDDE